MPDSSTLDWTQVRLARLDARKPLRRLPHLAREASLLLWRTSRSRFVLTAVVQLLLATAVALQLVAGRDALALVLSASGSGRPLGDIAGPVIFFGAVTAGLHLLRAVETLVVERLRMQVSHAALGEVLDVAAAVDLEAFETSSFFDTAQRATLSARDRPWATVNALIGLVGSVLGFVARGSVLASLEPLLVPFVVIATLPGLFVDRRLRTARYRLHLKLLQDSRQEDYLVRVLTGRDEAKEVRSFNTSGWLRRRHDELADRRIAQQTALAMKSARERLLASALAALATGCGLVILVWLVVDGRLDPAGAAAAGYAMQRIRGWLAGAMRGINSLYDGALFLEDYCEFVELGRETAARRPAGRVAQPFRTLSVEGLGFVYPGSPAPALDGLDFHISAGEAVALVGENGSGKTTLAKLLCGLYRPTSGAVMWDGVDITTFHPESVREHVSVIFQDFVRYRLSGHENIGLGRTEAMDDMDRIASAARAAGAASFLERLPGGYDAPLAKELAGGHDLSVGQWQRIALARALFRDSPFVVLDEPTAALDPKAEHALFELIRQVAAGRTVLLISHRFSSVRSCDRILVLERGRLIEQGTHTTLIDAGGRYAELFNLQAAAYVESVKTGPASR